MYRTARGAFESLTRRSDGAEGRSDCRTAIYLAHKDAFVPPGNTGGSLLAFARALGEYGATSMLIGYTPENGDDIDDGVSAVAHERRRRRTNRVLVNLAISAVVLLAVNLLEKKTGRGGAFDEH